MAGTLVLIDANSNVYRAYFALPSLTNAAGVPTNATLGFLNMLEKCLRESHPAAVVVVWDAPGKKRRSEMYPEYKANRDATPEDLRAQVPYIREIVDAYGLTSLEYEGEEADDVIATLATQADASGWKVEIVSTDKDLMQLATERIVLIDTMKDRRIGPTEVEERFGVPPSQVLDVRALVGDSSDNIPGVKGIGEKGASKLIAEFGSLDALLERIDEVSPTRARNALAAGKDDAKLSRELSRLQLDLPIRFDASAMAPKPRDVEALTALYRTLEFTRHLEALGAGERSPPAAEVDVRIVDTNDALAALSRRLEGVDRVGLAVALEPDEGMRGTCIAIAFAVEASAVDVVDVTTLEESVVLETLAPVFESERDWVGHDLKIATIALAHRGITLSGSLCDAGVAAYVADPGQQVQKPEVLARSYVGADLSSRETAFGKGAKRRPLFEVPPGELASHFGPQAAVALDLEARLREVLEATGQLALYTDLEMPLLRVLAEMERAGVRVDEAALHELGRALGDELARLEARIHELAGESFNIGSPKQLQHILFEKLALPPTKKTKTGFSTDESVLEELALTYELPGEILGYRRLAKLKSTYVDALPELIHPETGRIHGTFNQLVAATGRLSSSNPNLQNIPVRTPEGAEIRKAFIPADGCELVSADYSQIELRLLAHFSGDTDLVRAFHQGADIHIRTAAQVFGIDEADVDPEMRSRTKAINFGIIYGQSGFGLARTLKISQAEAREHIAAYFERYPGVKAFLDASKVTAKERGYSETLYGRRRYLPDLSSRNRVQRQAAERMATNSVLQGTAADLIKKAMVDIDAGIARIAPGARLILQVHDELVFEVLPAERDGLVNFVTEKMQEVAKLDVPLVVHVGCGQNWLEAH